MSKCPWLYALKRPLTTREPKWDNIMNCNTNMHANSKSREDRKETQKNWKKKKHNYSNFHLSSIDCVHVEYAWFWYM